MAYLHVVDGAGVVISSPTGAFEPYEVHYAETFIIPAGAEAFTLSPLAGECMVVRAAIR